MTELTELDRPIVVVPEGGGRPEYRASASGYCRRMLAAARLGYEPLPPRDFMVRAAREGKRHEEWVMEDLEEMGYGPYARNQFVAAQFPALSVTGHVDGLSCDYLSFCEVKSMSRARFETWRRKRFDAFPDYAMQLAAYWRLVSENFREPETIVFAVKCRDDGRVDLIELDRPPKPWDEVYSRLLDVELAARKKTLPDPECAPGSFERYICRWRYLCEEPQKEEVPEEIPDLSDLADDWRRGKALEEEADALIKPARERFREVMASRGLKKLVAWGLSLSLYASQRESFSRKDLMAAMAEEGLDKDLIKRVLDRAAKVTTTETLRIDDLEGAV